MLGTVDAVVDKLPWGKLLKAVGSRDTVVATLSRSRDVLWANMVQRGQHLIKHLERMFVPGKGYSIPAPRSWRRTQFSFKLVARAVKTFSDPQDTRVSAMLIGS